MKRESVELAHGFSEVIPCAECTDAVVIKPDR
jgi:hypothetical protein